MKNSCQMIIYNRPEIYIVNTITIKYKWSVKFRVMDLVIRGYSIIFNLNYYDLTKKLCDNNNPNI